MKFLVETMRSIADEATKKAERERGLVPIAESGAAPDIVVGIASRQGTLVPVHRTATAEEGWIDAEDRTEESERIRAWRQQTLDAFAGDDSAQLLVEGMLEGLKGKKLQELTELGDVAFASKQRLVRRRLENIGDMAVARRRA